MDWVKLLSHRRLGEATPRAPETGRSFFQRDFDAIVFSSAFRRLQDKTQVFPLSKSDYIRTRLTHSIETSCVGRSLGTMVGSHLKKTLPMEKLPDPTTMPDIGSDIGNIVASACLAHDIGNPPFGHAGEAAIKEWFLQKADQPELEGLDECQREDFNKFEGNAQGFRILTRLQNPDTSGGLQLTFAMLAAFTKYPRGSSLSCSGPNHSGQGFKKHNYFLKEQGFFLEITKEVGLLQRHSGCSACFRHPLAFLVEAADDICYGINDLEDGFRLKHVTFERTAELLASLSKPETLAKLSSIKTNEDKICYLRARAINALIEQVYRAFVCHEEDILSGNFDRSLLSVIDSKDEMEIISKLSKEQIYTGREVLEIEIPGFDVLGGLLDTFVKAVEDMHHGQYSSARNEPIFRLLPKPIQCIILTEDKYSRLLRITDFISGMTDSYAVSLYKQIKGISLPYR